jgi:hypothetical protein
MGNSGGKPLQLRVKKRQLRSWSCPSLVKSTLEPIGSKIFGSGPDGLEDIHKGRHDAFY